MPRYLLRTIYSLLLPSLLLTSLAAQSPTAPVTAIFAGLQRADTTGLADLFLPGTSLRTVKTTPAGTTTLETTDLNQWLSGIAGARTGDLNEELHYVEVRQDGDLATVWTPYTFVYQNKISHCGANSFQLVRTGRNPDVWRIFSITDTRNREGCERVDRSGTTAQVHRLADAWHAAATRADSAAYFDLLTPDAVFIGTDSTEHWTKPEFLEFAAPYFADGKAWAFVSTDRHVFPTASGEIAYWDELLDTWMGKCRGTGIARRGADHRWRIAHYTLSVTVPNERMPEFLKINR